MAGAQTLEKMDHCALAAGCSGDLLVREFVWGDRFPEPVAMVTHGSQAGPSAPSATSVYYYLPDILGSVLALADAAGNVVERYSYDPYGRTAIERHETGGAWTATAASSFGNPFAWTGQRYDAPVQLYHFLFRSYSPTLGRWLQRDPAGYVDGVNLLEAVRSNPAIFTDPFGLDTLLPRGGATAVKGDIEIGDLTQLMYGNHDNKETCNPNGWDAANSQTMSDLRAGLAALGDGALKTAIVADNISNVFFLKAFAKELAARGIKLVVKGGKKLFMQNGKELTARELRTIVLQVAKQLPKQIHHLATNKGAWKGVFEKLFSKAGMSLDDAANIMELPTHAGRHSDKYHEFVYDYLSKAVGSKTGQEAADALRSALQEVRQMLIDNPRLPFKDGGL